MIMSKFLLVLHITWFGKNKKNVSKISKLPLALHLKPLVKAIDRTCGIFVPWRCINFQKLDSIILQTVIPKQYQSKGIMNIRSIIYFIFRYGAYIKLLSSLDKKQFQRKKNFFHFKANKLSDRLKTKVSWKYVTWILWMTDINKWMIVCTFSGFVSDINLFAANFWDKVVNFETWDCHFACYCTHEITAVIMWHYNSWHNCKQVFKVYQPYTYN